MSKYNRIFTIVLDSLGIGAAQDADDFGDAGADTFGHICDTQGKMHIPNLIRLGMLNLHPVSCMKASDLPIGRYATLSEKSASKDTMAGHWEMMGVVTTEPFITFPNGFPDELVSELERRTGRKMLGNKVASGTAILDELGEKSIEKGAFILYTSADSVLQLAASEEAIGLDELHRCCEIAREVTLRDAWKVGRVIARPFVGSRTGEFERTANRRDYTVEPPERTYLDALSDAGFAVIGIGKIGDIFSMRGITESMHSDSSVHGMQQTIDMAKRDDWQGLCFINLVDFDAKWGHRRNPKGYAEEIERFDKLLGELMNEMKEDDLLIICADHGNDPTFPGSDHTREDIPFIAYSPSMKEAGELEGTWNFETIGATICDNFSVDASGVKKASALRELS